MKGIARFMLRVKGPEEKADVIWNTAGSLIYALANMILAFLVIRMAGEEAGGIFAMGFSTFGQQMFTLSYYGLRPFQITDGGPDQGGLSFGEYLFHRKITAGIAVAAAGLFAAWHFWGGSYSMEKAAAVFMLAGYKIVDGYADVYESEFQRQGKLYLTGKSKRQSPKIWAKRAAAQAASNFPATPRVKRNTPADNIVRKAVDFPVR